MKPYHIINYLEKNLEGLTEDELNKYNHSLGLIYKWITIAIQYRKKNITSRMATSKRLKTEREERIAEEN